MDIVSRLKQFISYLNIPVTQFADNCKIPRPTLSQLLNGRNKKVSDEFLKKIHWEYPYLNVLWLLYGEGDMVINEKESFSATQKSINFTTVHSESADDQGITNTETLKIFDQILPQHKITQPSNETSHSEKDVTLPNNDLFTINKPKNNITEDNFSDSRKKIVNIIVYYNDNSFEAFVPDGKGIF